MSFNRGVLSAVLCLPMMFIQSWAVADASTAAGSVAQDRSGCTEVSAPCRQQANDRSDESAARRPVAAGCVRDGKACEAAGDLSRRRDEFVRGRRSGRE
jgi:hypothetical protein